MEFLNKNYKLFCGDAFDVLATFPDHCIDAIICDPPYLIQTKNAGGSLGRSKKLDKVSDELENLNITTGYDIRKYAEVFKRICKDGMNLNIWCNRPQFKDYFNLYVNEYGFNFNILTWHKTNPLPGWCHKYLSDTEFCLNFFSPGHLNPKCYHDAFSYYISPLNSKDKKLWEHPSIKPLDFTEKIVRNCTNEGDIILDCFMGSGTTGVAALKNNRRFIGIEISEKYKEIAEKRIKEAQMSEKETTEKKFKFGIN